MKPLLEARQIRKQFSGVAVLKGIDFTLCAGQVHALMGGNGAGKSTLMKIIAGVETPDNGELTIGDRAFARLNPALAHQLGIYLVPQEPMLFPNLSVRENILFRLPKRADTVARLQDKLQKLNCQINLDASASTLEVADQQMVEILRGLMREARILILDEPTASLTPGETERLFSQIRALQALDVGIVFISHKLPEIRQLASHISVMRDGAVVLSGETAAYRDEQLINAMTPVSRDHALSDTQSCGCRYRATAVRNRRTFPCCGWKILPAKALSISIWRSAPERSSVWPGWWDPGAPNLPKPYTACVHRAPGESGWRTARLAATAPAPGWPAGWSICRKTARSRGCFSMRRCAGTR